jgi:hypothetical protein
MQDLLLLDELLGLIYVSGDFIRTLIAPSTFQGIPFLGPGT